MFLKWLFREKSETGAKPVTPPPYNPQIQSLIDEIWVRLPERLIVSPKFVNLQQQTMQDPCFALCNSFEGGEEITISRHPHLYNAIARYIVERLLKENSKLLLEEGSYEVFDAFCKYLKEYERNPDDGKLYLGRFHALILCSHEDIMNKYDLNPKRIISPANTK